MTQPTTEPNWTYCPDSQNPEPLQINSVSVSDDGSRCAFATYFERGSGQFSTYMCDSNGNLLWSTPFESGTAKQGVYWVDISGDGTYIAVGGQISETIGYIKVYCPDSNTTLLDEQTSSRVNQVSLSRDGRYLAACYDDTIEVYCLQSSSSTYTKIYSTTVPSFTVNSCMISRDGNTVVASGIDYGDDAGQTDSAPRNQVENIARDATGTTGKIFSFSVQDQQVTMLEPCVLDTGSMRVCVVDSGYFWAASLHDGSCILLSLESSAQVLWRYQPNNPNLSLAYAVDVTQTEAGDVYVACGANLKDTTDGGFLYLIKSVRMDLAEYEGQNFKAELLWSTPIKRGVNPGVSMDLNATYVSATDGKPVRQTPVESLGSLYLFSVETGELIWDYDTSLMNWPMKVSRDASCAFAGSDDGYVYYWKLTDS